MLASEAILPPRHLLPGATTPTIFVSVALHAAVVAGALLLGMGAPDDTTALESIAVSVISVQTASDSVSPSISDAAQTLVAAGAASPVTAEIVEPLDPLAPPDPEPPTPVAPAVEMAEPVETEPEAAPVVTAMIAEAVPVLAVAAAIVEPTETVTPVETVLPPEPETVEIAETAAVVQPVEPETVREIIEPVPDPAPAKPKPTPPKKAEPPPKRPAPPRAKPPPASSGAGGMADANTVAAAPARGGAGKVNAGGSAATSRYPGLVEARLKRALRFPRGADRSVGRVRVAFTVQADGGAGNIRISASSGSAILDQAALETVARAAPFPPIPADAGRSSWNFTVPLTFRR